jgi:hypothetical protein
VVKGAAAAAAARACRRAPRGRTPCAVVDEGPGGKGFVVALFDPSTNALKGFLSSKDGSCGKVKDRDRASSFATVKEAEAAAAKCKAKECPP